MKADGTQKGRLNAGGFTIVEAIIYLVIAMVVGGAVYQLFISQNRLYLKEREVMDVRGSLRGAAALLSWELRGASAAGGDLYSIGASSFTVRSFLGAGVICGEKNKHYGLWGVSGEFIDTADDSALVFAAGGPGPDDDRWKAVGTKKYKSPPAGGVPTCFWGDTVAGKGKLNKNDPDVGWTGLVVPDTVVQIQTGMDSVLVGAPYRAFRRVQYGLYQEDGRYWLGRRAGSAANYERLTGPLRSPWGDSGLRFVYYDRAGNTTSDPTKVAAVEIILRAESFGMVRRRGQEPAAQQDSLRTRVTLRG
jgi:hypothetical protein